MTLFDKQAERKVWLALLSSIPFVFYVLWREKGSIGKTEVIIAAITFLTGVGILYLVKWYSNKE